MLRYALIIYALFCLSACNKRTEQTQLETKRIALTNGDHVQSYTLSNDFLSISIIPALGGKITSLQNRLGREFIARSAKPYSMRVYGAAYSNSEQDGIDECFPSIGKTMYPQLPWKDRLIPDHGEIHQVTWHVESQSSKSITCSAQGKAFPYLFQRTISLDGTSIHFDYEIHNISAHTLFANYAFKPHFDFTSAHGIQLNQDADITLLSSSDNYLGEPQSTASWAKYLDKSGGLFKDKQTLKSGASYAYMTNSLQTGHYKINYKDGWMLSIQWPSQLFPYLHVNANHNANDGFYHLTPSICNSAHPALANAVKHKQQINISQSQMFTWRISIGLEEPVALETAPQK